MTIRPARPLRLLAACAGAAAAALGLSGCVGFLAPPAIVQENVIGNVILQVDICNGGTTSPTCPDPLADGLQGAEPMQMQILLAFRIPDGSVAPRDFSTVSGPTLTFSENASFEDQLDQHTTPIAGFRWVGYLSTQVLVTPGVSPKGIRVQPTFTLPRGTDGSPFPNAFRFRPIVGVRGNDAASGLPSTRPVVCDDELVFAPNFSEPTMCSDDPNQLSTVNGLTSNPVRDLGILATGATATVNPGATTTITFFAKYSGTATAAAAFQIAATTTAPGVTVTPNVSVLAPTTNSTTPVPVVTTVPAGTPAGTYEVRLTATLGNGQTRTNVGTLIVVVPDPAAPPAPPAEPPPPAPQPPAVVSDPQVGSTALRLRRGKVGVVLACPVSAASGCSGTVALQAKGRSRKGGKLRLLPLGSAPFALPSGRTRTVQVPVVEERRTLVPTGTGKTLAATVVVRVLDGAKTRVAVRRVLPLGR